MKKLLAMVLTILMLAGALAACSGDNGSSSVPQGGTSGSGSASVSEEEPDNTVEPDQFPITETPISITMGRYTYLGRFENINDMWKWQDYAEKTGITVDFKEYPESGWQETLQLELATGNLQDAYYQMPFTQSQMFEQVESGNFVELTDLIDQYAPNIKKIFEEYPDVKRALQMPDGGIYSLPFVEQGILTASGRYYVNKAFLEECEMDMPTTIEQLEAYLYKVKELHPDIYPYSMHKGGVNISVQTLLGAFNAGTTGIKGMDNYIDKGPDGQVRFLPSSEPYRRVLEMMAKWYADGLVNPESFTTNDIPRMRNLASQNALAFFTWGLPSLATAEASEYDQWIGINQFEGPDGGRILSRLDAPVRSPYAFIITSKNPNPIETLRWVDYFYGIEGHMYQLVGTEDVTYGLGDDGKYVYIGEAKEKYDENMVQYVLGNYGGTFPMVNNRPLPEEMQKILNDLQNPTGQTDQEKYRLLDGDNYQDILPEEVWPAFSATAEEAEELGVILSDLKPYFEEMQDKFITGAANIETEWDSYVATLERLGANTYLEIKQAQYERYIEG